MLKLNRQVFYQTVRDGPFPRKMTANQVKGMEDLLDAWEVQGTNDPRHLAYTLATNFHETGGKMQPVREGFKSSDAAAIAYVQRHYGHKGQDWYCWPEGPFGKVYYGRGDVQLTWYANYVKMGKILDLPLAENPDMVLQSKISKQILIEGMLDGVSRDGDFTGKSLQDYFNETTDDPKNARRIVNGKDKATLIAGYYEEFYIAVVKGVAAYDRNEGDDETLAAKSASAGVTTFPRVNDQTSWGGATTVVGGIGAMVAGLADKLSGPAIVAIVALLVVGAVMIARGRKNTLNETGE